MVEAIFQQIAIVANIAPMGNCLIVVPTEVQVKPYQHVSHFDMTICATTAVIVRCLVPLGLPALQTEATRTRRNEGIIDTDPTATKVSIPIPVSSVTDRHPSPPWLILQMDDPWVTRSIST